MIKWILKFKLYKNSLEIKKKNKNLSKIKLFNKKFINFKIYKNNY